MRCSTLLRFFWDTFHRLCGESWTDVELSDGIEMRLVLSRAGSAKTVVLRHGKAYKRSSFADSRGSLRLSVANGSWSQIVEFARSKGESPDLYNFHFDQKRDRVFYSLDGEAFSIPCDSIEEVDAQISRIKEAHSNK